MSTPKPRSGHYCAAWSCKNNSQNCNASFFGFPKDIMRAKIWAEKCGRTDLMENPQNLHRSYRVCGTHFETRMFLNDLRNRLQPHALPIIFRECERLSGEPSSLETSTKELSPRTEQSKIKKEEHIAEFEQTSPPSTSSLETSTKELPPCTEQSKRKKKEHIAESEQTSPSKIPKIDGKNREESTSTETGTPKLTTFPSNTQTPKTGSTPRKDKLRLRLLHLRNENARLKNIIKALQNQLKQKSVDITLDQYKVATHKFCPSKDIADFINMQVTQVQRKPKERRYTN